MSVTIRDHHQLIISNKASKAAKTEGLSQMLWKDGMPSFGATVALQA